MTPIVIWKGEIHSPKLKQSYEVEIHYGEDYPYRRPMVFPTDKKIRNNRHQNPTPSGSSSPGDICIFQDSLSDWTVGTDCREILARTINWFEKYENGLLDQEPSPPEIERYYSDEYLLRKPKVVIAETLTDLNDEKCGKFAWLPTQSGNFTFVATLGKKTSDYVINELSRFNDNRYAS